MMDIRHSTATRKNPNVKRVGVRPTAPVKVRDTDANARWLTQRAQPGAVVFVGGASVADFRLRYAQSHLRQDLYPSFWSLAGIVDSPRSMVTVPLGTGDNAAVTPKSNAIRRVPLQQINDVARFPNVGILHFVSDGAAIVKNATRLMGLRSAIDLPTLLVSWLAYAWAAGDKRNPLLEGVGIPSASMVQVAFGMSGIELAPGLTSTSSCPEAIWQSALWWHGYYDKTADVSGPRVAPEPSRTTATEPKATVPWGEYRVLQEAAAVTWER